MCCIRDVVFNTECAINVKLGRRDPWLQEEGTQRRWQEISLCGQRIVIIVIIWIKFSYKELV